MADKKKNAELPSELDDHLSRLRDHLGENAGDELKELVEAIVKRIDSAARSNPIGASAMFLARPTGYVV